MMQSDQKHAGFTLVEAVMVIAITGIVAAMVAVFIRQPLQGYFDSARRAELTDIADTAVRRISRDLHRALPNSVRVPASSLCVEFLPTVTGGRYRADVSGIIATPGSPLSFETATTTFDVLGILDPVPVAGDKVVVYNLGIPGADAYGSTAPFNVAAISSATATSITLSTATLFPFASPSNRFHVISGAEQAVSYVCSGAGFDASGKNGTGTLYRYSAYGISPALASCPAPGAGTPILATKVSSCSFTYAPGVSERSGLVSMQVAITEDSETVNLYQEVHVSNAP